MATRLKNIVRFLAVPPGVPTSLPHFLNIDNRSVPPDLAAGNPAGSFLIAADATNVTVTNQLGAPADINVYVEHWHTIEREFGSTPATYEGELVPQPFILGGAGGAGADAAPVFEVVYRPEDPAGSRANVYTTWAGAYAALQATAEFGQRYLLFDPQFSTTVDGFGFPACSIPPGEWDMTDVVWCSRSINVGVVIEEGARFVSDDFFIIDGGPGPSGLIVTYDGDGSSGFTPFDSLAMHLRGIRTRLTNTVATAAPMISAENGFFLASLGGNITGGIGSGNNPQLAPVIDLKGGSFTGLMVDGAIFDGVVTDSVGGGLFDAVLYTDGAFVEHGFAGDANVNFDWTSQPWGLAPGQGTVFAAHRDRHLVRFFDPVVTADYTADYNELVRVDTTGGPLAITLPFATPACGERVTVKDVVGSAGTNDISIVAQVGETIDFGNPDPNAANISDDYGSRTYVCDALGNWALVARV
jgi:hypothetical protein